MRLLLLFGFLAAIFSVKAQAIKAYGNVSDAETNKGTPGVKVQIQDESSEELLLTLITDSLGNFEGELDFTGRINVIYSSVGFISSTYTDLLVSNARDLRLDVQLTPQINELGKVTVLPKLIPRDAINPMASVSAYSITADNIERYAGSLDDPMRAIAVLPGITAPGGRYNSFSVRGNPPIGTLYRLEGIPVHNPNHFAQIGSTGGFVSQFSPHLLGTSDFFASAFPAEYGNATSAVFDFKFRKGNKNNYEHAVKVGVLGIDVASEGPLSKNHNSSYLINYRYSTLGLLARIIDLGGVLPQYQDLSFNLNLPTKKAGTFKVFGVGGLSGYLVAAETDPTQWDSTSRRVERIYGSNSGAFGIVHTINTGKRSYLHSVASISAGDYFDRSSYIEDDLSWTRLENVVTWDNRITFTSDYNIAFSRRHSNKTGVIITRIGSRFADHKFNRIIGTLDYLTNTEGTAETYQAFTQSKFRLNEKMTLMAGVHALYFGLNGNYSIEPRAGLNIKFSDRSMLSFGYGLHSRVEDLSIYLYQNNDPLSSIWNPNLDLDLMKSHQAVIRYSQVLFKDHRFNVETYYQYANNIPGAINGTTTVQNLSYIYGYGALENVGEAKNMGVEFMLERYAPKGMYYIISAAIFDSKYKAGDGVWRNTEYNNQYAFNILMGKEYRLKPKKDKERLLGLNINYHHNGGSWQTPIDSLASANVGWTQYDVNNPYSVRQPTLYNLDFSLTLKGIRKNVTGEFTLNIKNLIYQRITISQFFDPKTNEIFEVRDYGMIPVLSYKITF